MEYPRSRSPRSVLVRAALLFDHRSRIFVLAQAHKLPVSKAIQVRPFEELYLAVEEPGRGVGRRVRTL